MAGALKVHLFSLAVIVVAACAHQGDMPADCKEPVKAKLRRVLMPEYPARPFRDGEGGKVTVRIEVSRHGAVRDIEVLVSRPDMLFDEVVIKAVNRWEFEPARCAGRLVTSYLEYDVVFTKRRVFVSAALGPSD